MVRHEEWTTASIEFSTPPTLPPTNGYSHVAGVAPGSRLVWTSGQVPIAADVTVAAAGDREARRARSCGTSGPRSKPVE